MARFNEMHEAFCKAIIDALPGHCALDETELGDVGHAVLLVAAERYAKIAMAHRGAAAKARLARGMRLGDLNLEAQQEIQAEERGEGIASEIIAREISATMNAEASA